MKEDWMLRVVDVVVTVAYLLLCVMAGAALTLILLLAMLS